MAAADGGADTVLIERESILLGGALNHASLRCRGHRRRAGARETWCAASRPHARVRVADRHRSVPGASATTCSPLVHGNRMTKLRAGRVVVATGAIAQPAVFRYNDLPGICAGSGVQRLMRLYGVRPGQRAVCVTSNAEGYGVALELADAGVEVAAVIDTRRHPETDPRVEAVHKRAIAVHAGAAVMHARERDQHVAGVRIVDRERSAPGVGHRSRLRSGDARRGRYARDLAGRARGRRRQLQRHDRTADRARRCRPGCMLPGSVAGPCSADKRPRTRARRRVAPRPAATKRRSAIPRGARRPGATRRGRYSRSAGQGLRRLRRGFDRRRPAQLGGRRASARSSWSSVSLP
ncbi:MAG: hypothetical protein U5K73_00560 [Halofilum sp. (in: g-proteobacteria)]|nr:hypothetical protein [Halofilum sp. (in: g-proteobacteria)]